MATAIREIKVERTLVYRPNLAEVRMMKELVKLLTGSSSFTGRIVIDCCTGGIGEVSSRGSSEKLLPDETLHLTTIPVNDTTLIASVPNLT